jgi:uncharacterized protein YdeI (YjbR/CyaY-like superfamily)
MTDPTFFPAPAELRAWFEVNREAAPELLLGFHKVGSGRPSVTYQEALDAALCFGWIDGVRRNIDAHRYSIRFTPRKRKGNWSLVNIKRAAELIAQGLMHPAGLRAFEGRDEAQAAAYSHEQKNPELDAASERKFRASRQAWTFFQAQPPGYRRVATWYVVSPKREETREKRLAILIDYSSRSERLPMLTPPQRRQG